MTAINIGTRVTNIFSSVGTAVSLKFSSDSCGFVILWRPLWGEDGSVINSYNCFWALPEQSLWGTNPAKLTTIFHCLIRDSANLEGQVPVFISPRVRVAQLYPPALGSLSVASYDSQGYGAGIHSKEIYPWLIINNVGASHGNLPHVKNFGDQVTLMQIGIQATARQTGFPWWRKIATMHEIHDAGFGTVQTSAVNTTTGTVSSATPPLIRVVSLTALRRTQV
jgi:hypothetical protein